MSEESFGLKAIEIDPAIKLNIDNFIKNEAIGEIIRHVACSFIVPRAEEIKHWAEDLKCEATFDSVYKAFADNLANEKWDVLTRDILSDDDDDNDNDNDDLTLEDIADDCGAISDVNYFVVPEDKTIDSDVCKTCLAIENWRDQFMLTILSNYDATEIFSWHLNMD